MAVLTALLGATLLGCGRSLPPQADPEQARSALKTALEAWQKREPMEAIAAGNPPIYFNDPKCMAGIRLLSYEVDEGHEFHGQSVRLTASLKLEQQGGDSKVRNIHYLIDSARAIVIVPD